MAGMRPGSPEGEGEAAGEREADRDALDRLSRRIDAVREQIEPPPRKTSPGKYQALTLAWRMVLELVIGCAIGAAIGYAIDEVAATGPLFLAVFGLLGFAAGVKTMMASAAQVRRESGK